MEQKGVREITMDMLKEELAKCKVDSVNYNTNMNNLKVIKEMLYLLDLYDWKQMYSEYTTDGEKQVAVWEQNGDGKIRNHKIWTIQQIEPTFITDNNSIMYVDYVDGTHVAFLNGTIHYFRGQSVSDCASIIASLAEQSHSDICIDRQGYGIGLIDELKKYNANIIYMKSNKDFCK